MGFQGQELLEGLQEPFKSQITAMIAASGGRLYVKSGFRSHERQKQLWAEALRKYGDPEVADNWVARPGTSNHEHGWAVDLGFNGKDAVKWAHDNAGQFGMMFPLANENWHIEYAGERAGGQAAAMGGNPQGWRSGIMYDLNYFDPSSAMDPKDVLANRLHSVLSMVGLDAASMGPGVTVEPVADPSMDIMLNPEAAMATDIQAIPEAGARMEPGSRFGGVVEGPGGASGMGGDLGNLPGGGTADPNGFGAYAQSLFNQYGWTAADYPALVALWNEESGTGQSTYDRVAWNPAADNPSSTAYGIAQFLDSTWGGTGFQKSSDPRIQIQAGLKYIASRYGNPRNALDFHHRNNWY